MTNSIPKNAEPTDTLDTIETYVSVSEFRAATDALFRHVTYHVGNAIDDVELKANADMCRRSAQRLSSLGCKRAKREDWQNRERALDRSASLLSKILFGVITRPARALRLRVVK